jgi:hypothetical protein
VKMKQNVMSNEHYKQYLLNQKVSINSLCKIVNKPSHLYKYQALY